MSSDILTFIYCIIKNVRHNNLVILAFFLPLVYQVLMKLIIKLTLVCLLIILLIERYKNVGSVGTQTAQLSKDIAKLNESMAAAAQLDKELQEETPILSEQQLENLTLQKEWENRQSDNRNGQITVLEGSNSKSLSTQEQDCKGWYNSHLVEPSEAKEKYIKKHCQSL